MEFFHLESFHRLQASHLTIFTRKSSHNRDLFQSNCAGVVKLSSGVVVLLLLRENKEIYPTIEGKFEIIDFSIN
ncbi:hypothetical protein T4D_6318 [Trichinella pseudospiralis]|uniref:Uncharacterized protein n=1 Tax=Trichinella pseudospiralis TaxID=6337 RepID=A0A0V1FDZ0_TRIPS|nr:hypothetical protein T4D_6318 [Trichinella pseudospiralis]